MLKIGGCISWGLTAGAGRPWRFRIAALLVLLVTIWPVSQYLRLVMRNPQRTGLLLIGSGYSAPWDINPWCEENLATLEKLDKHNLSTRRLSDPSQLAFGQWAELQDDIEHLAEGLPIQQPLLVYINLHGLVSAEGRPYLVVRDSKPLDRSTWLPLDNLVERIRQALPRPRSVIIAIEGGRQHALPLPTDREHSFADAVGQWYAGLQANGKSQGLSIIVGSSSRFGAVEHAGVASDLFTACLAEALSGQCDQPSSGGNGNQQIEWSELERYVHDQVEQRSRQLRIVPQLIAPYVSDTEPSFIAWTTSLDSHTLACANHAEPDAAQVETLTQVWKRIYAIAPNSPWSDEAHAWGALKRTMVAWEQSLFGGSAGRSQAPEFEKVAGQLLDQLETAALRRDQPLEIETRLARRASAMWQQLSQSPSIATAQQIVSSDVSWQASHEPAALPMLAELVEQSERKIWSQLDLLSRWAALQARIEQVRAAQSQLPSLRELTALEGQVDGQRRQLEDSLLADAIDDSWLTKLFNLSVLVERWHSKCELVQAAIDFNEQMLARLPIVCRVVDMLDAIGDSGDKLGDQLDALEQSVERNRNNLAAALEAEVLPGDLVSSNPANQELFTRIAQRWQRMLFASSDKLATHVMPLEALLESSLLPIDIGSVDKAVQLRLTTHKRLAGLQATNHPPTSQAGSLDFGIRNQSKLARWLDWTNDNAVAQAIESDHAASDRAGQAWQSMHTARARSCFGIDESLAQPIRRWQQLRTAKRQLAASRRVLDDFWKAPQLEGQDYYAALARALVTDVSELERNDLESLLQLRGSAARDGLRLECECRPVWNEHAPQFAACRVQQPNAGVPEGLAVIQVIHSQLANNPSRDMRSVPVGIPVGTAGQSHQLQLSTQLSTQVSMLSPELELSTGQAIAQLMFRGHRFASKLDLNPRVGQAATGAIASGGAASITVQSTASRQRSRMLVLDCSASMYQPQATEGALDGNAPARTISRLDAARLALERILDHWRGGQDHVGVVLYGHRVAMGSPEQGKLVQMRYMSRYPFAREIEAYEDVETILPPGRFGDQEVSAVTERLQSVVPWGQTPLYLAVAQAVHELVPSNLALDPSLRAKQNFDVIVISDGRNYQFNPTADKNIGLEQVIEQARRASVRVHVIGFGIAADELKQATSEFTQLAEQTGGSVCMEVQTALQLVEQIDSLTEPETFRVRLPSGQWIDSRCGEPVALPAIEAINTPVLVDYQRGSTLIPINARSAVRLVPGGSHLVRAQPVFPSSARATITTASGQSSPFEIALEAPRIDANSATWRLSLERRDEIVAQRPKHLWIELQPREANTATTYVVCDPLWQAETTEPVLNFTTHDWPREATTGSLKFWCSDQLPEPLIQLHCVPASLSNDWISAERYDGSGHVQYQLQAEADGVTLVLWHGHSSEVLELMPLIENLPGDTRVDRRYQPSQRISIHRFSHPELKSSERLKVAIYSVSAFKSQSLRSDSAIEARLRKEVASVPVSVR